MTPCLPSLADTPHQTKTILTFEHLRNGSYQIPDLACGYTTVKLQNGKGETDGVKVVLGRAAFGYLALNKQHVAALHLAYFTDELGWLQEIVFEEFGTFRITSLYSIL